MVIGVIVPGKILYEHRFLNNQKKGLSQKAASFYFAKIHKSYSDDLGGFDFWYFMELEQRYFDKKPVSPVFKLRFS